MKLKGLISTLRILFSILLLTSISMSSVAKNQATKNPEDPLPLEDVQRFSTAINQIKNYYVNEVKDQKLFDNAIRGMLSGLDPHSAYLDENDYKELRESTRGEFGGLGIEVTMEDGVIKVISPIDDTPAFRAGLKAGDYIVRLDKKPIKGMTLRDAVNHMRGKRGSKIDIVVLRKGADKPLEFTIVRDIIKIQSVKSKLLDKYYGYIRVSHFQEMTARDTYDAVKTLKKEANGKLKGLILDLRNNPGGLLDSAIQISDAFIHNDNQGEEELIVYTKGRLPGTKFTAKATPGDVMNESPIVVLINEGSASASEIVAGALKDNKRAILIGTKTFGKGSVQTVLPLGTDRAIKLTTALYYTPAGISIQAEGIKPDIILKDITIPKKEGEITLLSAYSEADLTGHLENATTVKMPESKNKKEAVTEKPAEQGELIYKDYQLHHALNLLKGMAITKK